LDAHTAERLGRLGEKECHELSRLCALIFESEAIRGCKSSDPQ
jgi:hypothetical protein